MGAKEVAAGAEWLDENFPGWEREIDLGTLNMNSHTDCILGQVLKRLVGEWSSGWREGNKIMDSQLKNGILDRYTWYLIIQSTCMSINEPLWCELIKERFSTGNLSDV